MAAGQRTFSTEGREVKKFDNTPPPPGEYEARMKFADWKISVAEGVGKLPRVNGPIELLNTAANENAKNRQLYHDFFCDLSPSPKDGVAMVDRGGGITEFSKCTGIQIEGVNIDTKQKMMKDDAGNETGELAPVEVLNAQQLLDLLKQYDGMIVKLRTKNEKDLRGEFRAKVAYFIEGDVQQAESGTEEAGEAAEPEQEDLPEPVKAVSRPAPKVAPKGTNGVTKPNPKTSTPIKPTGKVPPKGARR